MGSDKNKSSAGGLDIVSNLNSGLSFITNLGDLFTGGAISNWLGSSQRSSDFEYWKSQQKVMYEYQKAFLDYSNESNLQYNKALTEWNNEQNKKLTDYYYNAYQSPQAQMQANKDAGLNPNLVAGNWSGSGLSPQSSLPAQSAGASPMPTASGRNSNTIGAAMEVAGGMANLQRILTETKYNKAMADKVEAEAFSVELANDKAYYEMLNDDESLSTEERYAKGLLAYAKSSYQMRQNSLLKSDAESAASSAESAVRVLKAHNEQEAWGKLKVKGLHPLLEETAKLIADREISEKNLDILGEQFTRFVRQNNYDSILYAFFDADLKETLGVSAGAEKALKLLMYFLWNAFSTRLNVELHKK